MKARYKKTIQADEDIIALYGDGVRMFGVRQAEAYVARLMDLFELIAEQPGLARERSEFNPPVRLHFHESHVVVYRLDDDGVLIVRVLNGREDWIRNL
ncbi:MAG: type II toxin-antitoxin system RelE/ParE family toxin [Bosea sp.]|nr:type II toxin-antitoxin system RelE/ParE family toxin [Bosea sp. (in: a-proteobacteria)]